MKFNLILKPTPPKRKLQGVKWPLPDNLFTQLFEIEITKEKIITEKINFENKQTFFI